MLTIDGQAVDDVCGEPVARRSDGRFLCFHVSRGEDGGYLVEGVVVLRDRRAERLTADAKAAEIVCVRISAGEKVIEDFRFTGCANGVEYGTARFVSLVDKHTRVVETGDAQRVSDTRQAISSSWNGDINFTAASQETSCISFCRREPAGTLGSFGPRTGFLASELGSHRYVFALHNPFDDQKGEGQGGRRPHVHVHAIVAMRSEEGERIGTTIVSFQS